MLSVQEALERILRDVRVSDAERLPLNEALGRCLAADVHASDPLPPFDNSSMDGYALRSADLHSLPRSLEVIGDIPAGTAPSFTVQAGQAARIMTGAALPTGADLVVPIEDSDQNRSEATLPPQVTIYRAGEAGAYIRRRGEDVSAGEKVLEAGHLLRPQDLGLLAGLGIAQVSVRQRPRVGILSTGDELLPPNAPLEPGKIRDMNSYTLPAMVQQYGGEALFLGRAADHEAAVREALQHALALGVDLIISSAGVSVGARDVVRNVLQSMGSLDFWRVNMRPGKPLAYGQVQGLPFMGVPGNPVSALATFELFARPMLLKMQGRNPAVPLIPVIAGAALSNDDGRESYIRVTLHRQGRDLIAQPTPSQSSGAISSLVKADALLIIPAGVQAVAQGEALYARPFGGQGILV